jgi:hypothetical protein
LQASAGDAAGDPADTRDANYASRRHIAGGIGAVLEYLLQLLLAGEPGAYCKIINGLIGTGSNSTLDRIMGLISHD